MMKDLSKNLALLSKCTLYEIMYALTNSHFIQLRFSVIYCSNVVCTIMTIKGLKSAWENGFHSHIYHRFLFHCSVSCRFNVIAYHMSLRSMFSWHIKD